MPFVFNPVLLPINMFKSLIKNTLISGVAFFAVSVLGLLLVPYLVSAYGVAGFGVISLARLFIPLMGMGIFDLGFGEIATHSVARARAESRWGHALAVLLQISLLALGSAEILTTPPVYGASIHCVALIAIPT